MISNRYKILATCFAVLLLAVTMSVYAGTTTVVGGAKVYAREVGIAGQVYTVPAQTITRDMSVIRSIAQDFFLDVTLGNGFTFNAGGLPAAGNLAQTGGAGGTSVITIVGGGAAGDTTVRFFVDVTNAPTTLPQYTLTTTGWRVNDVNNVLGGGGTVTITVSTNDSATNVPFDNSGTDQVNWCSGGYAVTIAPVLVSTTATIDVATNRLNFVAVAGSDTLTTDVGATIGVTVDATRLNAAGAAYALLAADTVRIGLTSSTDFSAVANAGITWAAIASTAPTATTRRIDVAGNNAALNGTAQAFVITISGTTTLQPRTIYVAVDLILSGGASGPVTNGRTLQASSTLTVWNLNGTVLVANYANGNNGTWLSRFYLWNGSTQGGNVSARVYTLPIAGNPVAQVGTTVALGTLAGQSGRNVRLAEDILTPAGVTLPYTTDGGNVVVEFTIEATSVSGVTQTFQLVGGMYAFTNFPMNRIQ